LAGRAEALPAAKGDGELVSAIKGLFVEADIDRHFLQHAQLDWSRVADSGASLVGQRDAVERAGAKYDHGHYSLQKRKSPH
jgi:hypothetical protein